MGMYDYLKCEYPLPDKEAQDYEFQTKDFGCVLELFVIMPDGKLLSNNANVWAQNDGGKLEPYSHTGEIEFGTIRAVLNDGKLAKLGGNDEKGHFVWGASGRIDDKLHIVKSVRRFDYRARFIDGQLESLIKTDD